MKIEFSQPLLAFHFALQQVYPAAWDEQCAAVHSFEI
jgi:hypothetical protein